MLIFCYDIFWEESNEKRWKELKKQKVNYKHSKIVYFAVLLFLVAIFSTGIHYLLNLNNTKTDVVEQNSLAETNAEGIYTYTVSNNEATITACDKSASGEITIPSTLGGYTVTIIGEDAFSFCTSITSIIIPNSVTSIDSGAFYTCDSLTSITIPNNVTSIGGYAFDGCTSLTNITLSNSLNSIEGYVFDGCRNLITITIPESVVSIGGHAFSDCTSLTTVEILNSKTSINESAFVGCVSLTSMNNND